MQNLNNLSNIASFTRIITNAVAPPVSLWILSTGFWDDIKQWVDTDIWID